MKAPKFTGTVIVSDDAELAARMSCLLARTGHYLPIINGPRLTRPDPDAEVTRRNNAIARTKSKEILLAGLSSDASRLLKDKLQSRKVRTLDDDTSLNELKSAIARFDPEPIRWGRDYIGIGLLNALRARRGIIFTDSKSSTFYQDVPSTNGHIVFCEDDDPLAQVIAANYAFSLGAGLSLTPSTSRTASAETLERFYSIYDQQSETRSNTQLLEELQSELRTRCGPLNVPEGGSATFITGGLPYGFAFPEIPSTHLLDLDLGISIVNGFAAEQFDDGAISAAVLVNPDQVAAPEIRAAGDMLVRQGVFVRGYEGPAATVQSISKMIEYFPYDLLIIATHCGDASGFRWTYEYTDSEGIERTLVVDIALGISETNEDDLLNVLQFTCFVSLDGVDWHDPQKSEKLNVGKAITDWMERTRSHDLEPVKKEDIPRVRWSAALKMYDNNYIAVPRPLAGSRTPLIINNACSSWHRLAETFSFNNARGYIGTLFPVSNSEAEEVITRLLRDYFRQPIPVGLWSAQQDVYGEGVRRPYVMTGVYPQHFRTSFGDHPRTLLERLRRCHTDWKTYIANRDADEENIRELKEIVQYHEQEIEHFEYLVHSAPDHVDTREGA